RRILRISWCTNSPACVVGSLPARLALRAFSTVVFSGITFSLRQPRWHPRGCQHTSSTRVLLKLIRPRSDPPSATDPVNGAIVAELHVASDEQVFPTFESYRSSIQQTRPEQPAKRSKGGSRRDLRGWLVPFVPSSRTLPSASPGEPRSPRGALCYYAPTRH